MARYYLTVLSLPPSAWTQRQCDAYGWHQPEVGERIELPLASERPVTIGRSPHRADVALPSPSIGSHRPYQLKLEDGRILLISDSTHEARVNGRRADRTELQAGDILELGTEPYVLRLEVDADS
jgi:hypothetical protein